MLRALSQRANQKPSRPAPVRFKGGEGSTQVVQLLHGALHRFTSATMDAIASPPPHSIFHHGIRGRGGTIFWPALPSDERRVQADMRTHLIHRPARDTIPPLGGVRVTPCAFDLLRCHAAVTISLFQRNSVPSTRMRCKLTASRRARATIAFFIPRRLAICIAQALSQDHFFERSMLCAAS